MRDGACRRSKSDAEHLPELWPEGAELWAVVRAEDAVVWSLREGTRCSASQEVGRSQQGARRPKTRGGVCFDGGGNEAEARAK